jgi:hypothetical protein
MKKYTLVKLPLLFVMALVLMASHCAEAAKPSDVIVINEPTEPVPTRDVDNPAQQPIQASRAVPVGSLKGPDNFVIFKVPAGKRLVVEHFSSQVGIDSAASVSRYILGIALDPGPSGTSSFGHFIAPTYHSPCSICEGTTELFIASQPIRMYVNAGYSLFVNITFSGAVGDFGFGFFAVSGYLVDLQ